MDADEISERTYAIMNAKPPFPEVYQGALFPAGNRSKPTIVPVPLDYGLGSYVFPEDLQTKAWIGAQIHSKQWRMEAGGGAVYLAWAYPQKLAAGMGGAVNSVLSDAPSKIVYGDILVLKESQERECIVDLDEADIKHIREKFRRKVVLMHVEG